MSWYFPTHLYVETSDFCNRSCAYCPIQRDRPPGPARRLDLGLYRGLLEQLRDAGRPVQVSLQWVDEPLSNPAFFEYIALGRELLPDARWLLQSNGDYLDAEAFEALKRDFDGVVLNFYDERPYERFVAREWDYVPAQFKRRHQSPGRLRRAHGFEARVDEAIVHLNRKFEDEEWVQWHDAVTVPGSRRCLRPWVHAAIAFDGAVYVCCRDNHRAHPVGDLGAQTLFEAYNSPAARALRARMEAGERQDISMCRTCPNAFPNRFEALDAGTAARLAGAGPPEPEAARTQLPYGSYDYLSARSWAKRLGHVALPGIEPRRYEYVVGLTPDLRAGLVAALLEALGEALVAVFVAGSRVMTRARLALVDRTPFEDPDDPLEVGAKDRLRIFGPDPALSSDLDLKVLVDAARCDEARAEALAGPLGATLEALAPDLPISGHAVPRIHLHRVPSGLGARQAFLHYDEARFARFGKGRLSLEYTQLLFDPRRPAATEDPSGPVRARLRPRGPRAHPLDGLGPALGPERFEGRWGGLTYHQLVMALLDFPDLEPPDVVFDVGGRVVEGRLGAEAAREAGRIALWAT